MLNQITQFFRNKMTLGSDADCQHATHPLQLATAALLIEVTRADFTIDDGERNAVAALLKKQFQLPAEELETLITLAQEEADLSISLYPFTRLINDHYSLEQKSQLVLTLWKIALADGYLDKHEDHLIRKVADLIHVPHQEFIRTKLQAIEALKQTDQQSCPS